jgi:hypothetical protein
MQPEAVIQGLIERGMPPHLAYGFAGNFAVESEFNPDLNERAPLIPGSRGGYGLAQWTGPRRLQLEDFAEQRGVPVSDMDMQLDFLMSELQGSENRAWQAIQAAQDPAEAARLVSEEFLRPGIPHLDRRINTALQLAGMEPQTMQFDATGTPQQPRGFLGGIFGGQQRQPDPNAGSPTDPFANLSQAQRTMLGFAALRDAAASLEGRDSNYFSSALGGFEAARERERLRAQGIFQNQVAAAQALAQVQADIARNRAFGIEPTEAQLTLERMLSGAALEGFGGVTPRVTTGATPPVTPAGGAPGATPSVVRPADQDLADRAVRLDPETGGVDAAGRPFPAETPEPVVTPSELPTEAAPTPVAEPDVAAQIRELDEEYLRLNNQVMQREANNAGFADLQFLIEENRARRGELTEAQAAAEQAAAQQREDTATSAERAEQLILPEINEALDFLVRGFDEQGQPVFNPALETRAGRAIAGALEGPEYQNYVGVIQTLRTGVLLDALEQATVGALSDGEREALSAAQGQLDPANPQGTYRAIMRMQEIAQESIDRRNREAGASNGAATPQINWD